MNELTVPFNGDELGMIGSELERLFTFHDKTLTKEKKAYLVAALGRTGMPVEAVIQGLRSLMLNDEVERLKLGTIVRAARQHVIDTNNEIVQCDACRKSGRVVMRDSENRFWVLACHCPNGKRGSNAKLTMWTGDETQVVRHRALQLVPR